ncbi:hypothetical protein ZHAS_00017097 [Anopheles sinensis]|uniref:Uncharacterized protein n=1 Tax=Anopheles sinensis TaxID=74873 RepID=A0A084WF47_ANOSI|nr:hypothetical protein ZHAS_00017097 [Anopheles sinensis]
MKFRQPTCLFSVLFGRTGFGGLDFTTTNTTTTTTTTTTTSTTAGSRPKLVRGEPAAGRR